jgi:hypothetical protein
MILIISMILKMYKLMGMKVELTNNLYQAFKIVMLLILENLKQAWIIVIKMKSRESLKKVHVILNFIKHKKQG